MYWTAGRNATTSRGFDPYTLMLRDDELLERLRITSASGRVWTGVFASDLSGGRLSLVASWPEPSTLFVSVGGVDLSAGELPEELVAAPERIARRGRRFGGEHLRELDAVHGLVVEARADAERVERRDLRRRQAMPARLHGVAAGEAVDRPARAAYDEPEPRPTVVVWTWPHRRVPRSAIRFGRVLASANGPGEAVELTEKTFWLMFRTRTITRRL